MIAIVTEEATGEEIAGVTGVVIGVVIGVAALVSVLALGDFSFGQPSRITATARVGRWQVVDIEREVKLGGAYHSKGVLILSNFFAQRATLSETPPPCPGPKKKTAHSPASVHFAAGTA